MLEVHGIAVAGPPHLRYAARMDVVVWPLHTVTLDAVSPAPEF